MRTHCSHPASPNQSRGGSSDRRSAPPTRRRNDDERPQATRPRIIRKPRAAAGPREADSRLLSPTRADQSPRRPAARFGHGCQTLLNEVREAPYAVAGSNSFCGTTEFDRADAAYPELNPPAPASKAQGVGSASISIVKRVQQGSGSIPDAGDQGRGHHLRGRPFAARQKISSRCIKR